MWLSLLSFDFHKALWSILTILPTVTVPSFQDALWEIVSALIFSWTFGRLYRTEGVVWTKGL